MFIYLMKLMLLTVELQATPAERLLAAGRVEILLNLASRASKFVELGFPTESKLKEKREIDLAIAEEARRDKQSVASVRNVLNEIEATLSHEVRRGGEEEALYAFVQGKYLAAAQFAASTQEATVLSAFGNQWARMRLFAGHCYVLASRYEEAAKCFNDCLPIVDRNAEPARYEELVYSLIVALLKAGRGGDALEAWRNARINDLADTNLVRDLTPDQNIPTFLTILGELKSAQSLIEAQITEWRHDSDKHQLTLLKLGPQLIQILIMHGDLAAATKLADECQNAAQKAMGADAPETLLCGLLQARCLHETGSITQACELADEVLPKIQEKYPETALHFQTLLLTGELQMSARKFLKAKEQIAQAAAGLESVCGPMHHLTLGARLAQAELNMRLRNEQQGLQEIVPLLNSLFSAFGPDHPLAMRGAMIRAMLLTAGGATKDSEQQMIAIVQRADRNYGDDHAMVYRAKLCLARVADAKQNYKAVEELAASASQGLKQRLGEFCPEHLQCTYLLSGAFAANKKVKEALEMMVETIKDLGDKLGRDHFETVRARVQLSIVLGSLNETEDALGLVEEMQKPEKRPKGIEPIDTFSYLNWTGSLCEALNKLQEAEACFTESLAAARSVANASPAQQALALCSLGAFHARQHRNETALVELKEALPLHVHVLGRAHGNTVRTIVLLATVLQELGRPEEAIRLLEESANALSEEPSAGVARIQLMNALGEIHKSRHATDIYFANQHEVWKLIQMEDGEDSRQAQGFGNNLGIELIQALRLEETERVWRAVLESRERAFGPRDYETMSSLNNLGSLYAEQGNWQKATEFSRITLDRRTEVLGREHFDTIKSIYNYANNLQKVGRKEEAIKLAHEAYNLVRKHFPEEKGMISMARSLLEKLGELPAQP
ncbi:MAG: hypothetical protein B7Z37_09915 [Verrucomicrobia bacterium 12-59-8]|nr:MAG: hypothetical protein B7Z37_09915 [Verrucomicrobia bacterium 12-59-8]